MIGRTFAHYEIKARLGAGGMGEVYQATDTKLGRSVAIKILPDKFASDPDRVARFGREAKMLAALNHPNIAAIYGLEESDATHFLVLELAEGETLADRLQRTPIPATEALQIARQIAEALESAHDKGVIHRDIKPANIKIAPDGKVKVLDFGLAKAFAADPVNSQLTNSPTMSLAATHAGVILGTAAYMSPEQAKGTVQIDKRTDLFSLGCVIYEMLTGRQPFQGDSITEVLAGVLAREADLNLLPPNLNPKITDLVRRCLQKDLKKRWQGAGDLRVEIESILANPAGLEVNPSTSGKPKIWKGAALVIAGLIAGTAIGGLVILRLRPVTAEKPVRFSFELPTGQSFTRAGRQVVTISPDGANIVYVANQQLYIRAIGEMSARPIPGTSQDPILPFFSPDGQSIGFYAASDGTLKRIAISGGAAVALCKIDAPTGANWEGDRIVFAQGPKGIFEVAATGGTPKQLAKVSDDEVAESPEFLPGGNAIIFTIAKSTGTDRFDSARIVVHSLDTNTRKTLITGGSAARYAPTGHIVYALSSALFAVPFDLGKLSVTGGPVPIVESVMRAGTTTDAANFAFSKNGSLVYVPNRAGEGIRNLAVVDRATGVPRVLPLPPGSYDHPRISPDGKKLVVQTEDQGGTISVYDLSGTTSIRRLTFEGGNSNPIWSPDNVHVTYQSTKEGKSGIYWQLADGTGVPTRLTTMADGDFQHRPRSWLNDGKTLIYSVLHNGEWGIWTIQPSGNQKPEVLEDLPNSIQGQPALSPNGHWLAYSSSRNWNTPYLCGGFPENRRREIPDIERGVGLSALG